MPREDWVTQAPEFLNHFKGYVSQAVWTESIAPQAEITFTVTEIIDPPDLTTATANCWYSVGRKGEWVIDPDGRVIRPIKEGKKFALGSKYGMLINAIVEIDAPENPIPILDLDPHDMDSWLFQGFEMKREELKIPEAFVQQRRDAGDQVVRETTSFMRPLAYLGKWNGQGYEGGAPIGAATVASPMVSGVSIIEQLNLDDGVIEKLVAMAKGKTDALLRIAAKRDADLGTAPIMDALINKNLMQELEQLGAVSKGVDGKYQ